MYKILVCSDLYGYISEEYQAEGISFFCESEEELVNQIKFFLSKGLSVCVERKEKDAEN